MNDAPGNSQQPPADTLAMQCLAHLGQEEAMLADTLEILRQIRAALLQRDLDSLSRALQQQQHTAKAAAELAAVRARLRETLARALGVAHGQGTIADIARHASPALGHRLLDFRQRLTQMAREIDQLNRGNIALIQQSMELLQQLILVLTGGDPTSERYGINGRMEQAGCASMFQARC